MSNETIEVPVDLLRRIQNEYPSSSAKAGHLLNELQAFIPAPPKVGDTITGVQFTALPPLSVMVDDDGDVWVRTERDWATLVEKTSIYAGRDEIITHEDEPFSSAVLTGVLVHIGTTEEDN